VPAPFRSGGGHTATGSRCHDGRLLSVRSGPVLAGTGFCCVTEDFAMRHRPLARRMDGEAAHGSWRRWGSVASGGNRGNTRRSSLHSHRRRTSGPASARRAALREAAANPASRLPLVFAALGGLSRPPALDSPPYSYNAMQSTGIVGAHTGGTIDDQQSQ